MRTVGKLTLVTKGDREVVMTRAFTAPRALVFAALTRPDLLKRWFHGPDGWTLADCLFEPRVGGTYRYRWDNADGRTMAVGGRITRFEPPALFAATEGFEVSWYPGEALTTTALHEGGGTTTLTMTVRYQYAEARAVALGFPMESGVETSMARLEALLASQHFRALSDQNMQQN